MTREEAKEILTHNWTRVDNPNYSESELDEAFFMAIEALQNEETLKTQLANCHKEILRLLDFNDITESPDDVIESQNDVIEVVRCEDCVYHYRDNSETLWCAYPWRDRFFVDEDDYCSKGWRGDLDE